MCYVCSMEENVSRVQGEGQGELILLRSDLQSKASLVASLQSEIAAVQATLHSLESEKKSVDAICTDLQLNIEGDTCNFVSSVELLCLCM